MQTTDIGPDANGNPRGWLRSDAAASLARVDREIGRPLDVNSAGRTVQQQLDMLAELGPGVAAQPDDSWHVKGIALDSGDCRDPAILAILRRHGWTVDTWEWWHLQYHPELDQYANDTIPDTQEDTMRFIDGPDIIVWPNGVINSYPNDDYTLIKQFVLYPTHPVWSKGRANFERAAWGAFGFGTSAIAAATVKALPVDSDKLTPEELAELIRDALPKTWTVTAQ